jgi:predicted regulator of Ras-like GTPase activity (Roadblock/LC7/MglB family)
MFRESIQKMIERLDPPTGATGILMGFDGISVDSYSRPGTPDVQTVSMALTHVIAQVKRSTQGAHLGQFREMEVKTDKLALLIRIVTDRYFLVLGVSPEGNLGKARYLLRLLSPQILAQL